MHTCASTNIAECSRDCNWQCTFEVVGLHNNKAASMTGWFGFSSRLAMAHTFSRTSGWTDGPVSHMQHSSVPHNCMKSSSDTPTSQLICHTTPPQAAVTSRFQQTTASLAKDSHQTGNCLCIYSSRVLYAHRCPKCEEILPAVWVAFPCTGLTF